MSGRRRVALVVGTLALLGLTANPAQGGGDWHRIAYVADGDVHVVRPDGSGVRRLTWTGDNEAPAWSPDGLRLAFASRRDGDLEIYTMTAWGTRLRKLTDNDEQDSDPAWSPDGQQIAFTRSFTFESGYGEEHGRRLWVMAADGSGQHHLQSATQDWTGEEFATPVWSPDGTMVATLAYWVERLNDEGLYVTDLHGNDAWPLASVYSLPSWAPDGSSVVTCGLSAAPDAPERNDLDCWQVPLTGTPTTIGSSREHRETTAAWSPNGRLLAIGRSRILGPSVPDGWGPPVVTIMRRDGSLRDLATGLVPVAWSPDGGRVLATADGALHVIGVWRGRVTPLGVTGEDATWRPIPWCIPGVTAPTCPAG